MTICDLIDELVRPLEIGTRVLLVLDQAEELLAHATSTESDLLVAALRAATEGERAWLVYTLRSDFVTQLLLSTPMGPLLQEDYLVKPLGRDGLIAAIAEPAAKFGWTFDALALDSIANDVDDGRALPLLAYALDALWTSLTASGRYPGVISLSDYTSVGRVQDVLADRAENAFRDAMQIAGRSVSSGPRYTDTGQAEQMVLQLLRRLVAVRADGTFTRRAIRFADLTYQQVAMIQPFVEARVLTTVQLDEAVQTSLHSPSDGSESPPSGAEVSHEALFDRWPRLHIALEQIVDAIRARTELERLVEDWVRSGKGDDYLLVGSRLLQVMDRLQPGLPKSDGESIAAKPGARLALRLRSFDVAEAGCEFLLRSIQHAVDQTVQQIERDLAVDSELSMRRLAGTSTVLDQAMLGLLLNADDLGSLLLMSYRVMAAARGHRIFTGHESGVWGAAWAPSGEFAATGSRDQTVRIWSVASADERAVMHHGRDSRGDGQGWVRSVAWTADGAHVLSVATDETLRIWTAHGGEVRVLLHPGRLWTVQVAMTQQLAVTAGADGTARVWQVTERVSDPSTEIPGDMRLWAAALSPQGNLVATASEDRYAYIYEVPGGEQLRRLGIHPEIVRCVGWSPDGRMLATGCQDCRGRVYDATSGVQRAELGGHGDQVRAIAWSPDGERIATASADSTVRIWDVRTGSELLRLDGHTQGVCALSWSPTGDRLLSAADDATARVWKVGAVPTQLVQLEQPASALGWSAIARQLAVAIGTGERVGPGAVVLVDLHRGVVEQTTVRHDMPIRSVQWSKDGSRLLTASLDRTAAVWALGLSEKIVSFAGARDGVEAARWAPDETTVATASRDRVVRLWSAEGTPLWPDHPSAHTSFIQDVDWDPSGTRFALVSADQQVSIHDVRNRSSRKVNAGDILTSVAWSPIDRLIAVGRRDGAVAIFVITDDIALRFILHGHSGDVRALAWSSDGRLLCSVSADGTGAIWDAHTGAQLTALIGHTDVVTSCVWLTATSVATCSRDQTIRVWDVSDALVHPMAGLPLTGQKAAHDADLMATLIEEMRLRLGVFR